MPGMTVDQIKALWIQAGGNPVYAGVAAAFALAESAGNPNATHSNGNGSIDRGLWQINSTHGTQSTLDPLGNAKAAVAISNNGLNWRPWCTAYTDGKCGQSGGTYNIAAGSGSSVGKFIAQATGGKLPDPSTVLSGQITPGANPLADPARAAADAASVDGFLNGVMSDFYMTINVVLNNIAYLMLALGGGAALIIGIVLLAKDSVVGSTLNAVKAAI